MAECKSLHSKLKTSGTTNEENAVKQFPLRNGKLWVGLLLTN